MSKHIHGNDQVIAEFFKKSMLVISIITIVIAMVVYFVKKDKQRIIAKEKVYQAPTQLINPVQPPETLFIEEAQIRGIKFTHENGATGQRMLPETMGSGVAFIDFDNDGDQDLVFANGTNWQWDKSISPAPTQQIYANNGKGYFNNVTELMGLADNFYGTGIAIGDVNSDGYDDIFIAAVGKNVLYLNQQGRKFIKSDIVLDCTEDGWSTSSGFFDYDNDGDLDLMVLNYVKWSKQLDLAADYKIDGIGRAYGPPSNFPGTHNCLFENQLNQDDGGFIDVTEQSGIKIKNRATNEYEGKSLALTFLDINSDGWQDVIVANDTTRNFVYVNQQNNTFTEQGESVGLAYNANGKADDEWFELAGSEYNDEKTIHNYEITYTNPHGIMDVAWVDNQGKTGFVKYNTFHKHSFFPEFSADKETITFSGTLLENKTIYGSMIINPAREWGYVDNFSSEYTELKG
ncbi:MAG: VCBS repeat-containing protein, partial [Alcanivoracaceae bacterium]|nr:VCBS repeat-containing protein [Alcanivoracaceae bacterium]